MIAIEDEDIVENTNLYLEAYNKVANIPFTMEKFLKKSTPKMAEQDNLQYPLTVNIPRSINELLDCDFTPARTFVIEKPLEGPYGPMWFGDAGEGIRLCSGYRNGDSRYIGDYRLGDANVHGILAGSTGQGKSVTMNAYIYGMCYAYAPWELNLILCDPKIVEFKKIALNMPMPQVKAVAATEDIDYILSILDRQRSDMIKRNSIFVKASAKLGTTISKISEFREATGLNMPQVVIIVDEFQTLFKNAGKKLRLLMQILDAFARLGRNTGYHLLMASQELGADMDKNILANFKLRMAMGCYKPISQQILESDSAAVNFGQRGRMVLNDNLPAGVDNEVQFRIPYPPGAQLKTIYEAVHDKAVELDVQPVISFFDDATTIYEKDYLEYLSQFHPNPDKILLGEPAFLLEEADQCLSIKFRNFEREGIYVAAIKPNNLARFLKMFMINIEMHKKQGAVIDCISLCPNVDISDSVNLDTLIPKQFQFNSSQYEDNPYFDIVRMTVFKRILMLKADAAIFAGNHARQKATDEMFDEIFGTDCPFATELNRERFAMCYGITGSDKMIRAGFKLEGSGVSGNTEALRRRMIEGCINLYNKYGVNNIQLTKEKIPIFYCFTVGLNGIVGLGLSSKYNNVEQYKNVLFQAGQVKVRIINFSTSTEDLKPLVESSKWIITDGPSQKDISGLGLMDYYPTNVGPLLSVYFDKTSPDDGCLKFKKMARNGEQLL